MRRIASLLVPTLAAALVAPQAAAQSCPTEPTYDPSVTPPEEAIPGFPTREVTVKEIVEYFTLVDEESDRVAVDTFGTSYLGFPLIQGLVASEENLAEIDDIAARLQALRDPRTTSPATASDIAATTPAIAWYTANVHGDEESGSEASISLLYELAAGKHCAVVEELLGNLVVGLMPSQNPDGRQLDTRRNAYGFDLNRDWFAWTQRETEQKIPVLPSHPPVMFIDAHEMGGTSYFFPPNADPVYHEITDQSLDWIEDYGSALAQEFTENGWDFFTREVFDLFYMGYGDTVPTEALTSAGMTFEEGGDSPMEVRWLEQFTAGWVSLQVAASHKAEYLNEYYEAHAEALAQGKAGLLEPNEVINPENEVVLPVPNMKVRHYFVEDRRDHPYVAELLHRLLTMGVEVYRLTADLPVSRLERYGRPPAPEVVPAGSYWIPMAQPQKHWVQAMLHEDPYVPFPYFYDVTAWSNPLLMNLDAGFTGETLSPAAAAVTEEPGGDLVGDPRGAEYLWFRGDTGMAIAAALALARAGLDVRRLPADAAAQADIVPEGAFVVEDENAFPLVDEIAREYLLRVHAGEGGAPAGLPVDQPKIALYQPSTFGESFEHLRFQLEQVWQIPFTPLRGGQVQAGALSTGNYELFVVPGVATGDLRPARDRIEQWISQGGIYVGTARPGGTGGTPLAVSSGWTSAALKPAGGLQVPGTLFRVRLEDPSQSPVALGAKRFAYWYHLGEQLLLPTTTGVNAGLFPTTEPDFWFSGYAEGTRRLKGTAALVDEALGEGRLLLFSGEPNYRAYTEGSAFLLANAIVYPLAASAQTTSVTSAGVAGEVAAARASAEPSFGPGRPIRIEVPAADAERAAAVLRAFTGQVSVAVARGSAFLQIANPKGLPPDQHPFARRLLPALATAGVEVRSAIL
jgi:hypothetical protein